MPAFWSRGFKAENEEVNSGSGMRLRRFACNRVVGQVLRSFDDIRIRWRDVRQSGMLDAMF
jgi:hypothetical protein